MSKLDSISLTIVVAVVTLKICADLALTLTLLGQLWR
jgi:hypothetical protein